MEPGLAATVPQDADASSLHQKVRSIMECFTGPALGESSKNMAVSYNEYITFHRAVIGMLQGRGMPLVPDVLDQTV